MLIQTVDLSFSGASRPNAKLSAEVLSPQGEWTPVQSEVEAKATPQPDTQSDAPKAPGLPKESRGYSLFPNIPYAGPGQRIHTVNPYNNFDDNLDDPGQNTSPQDVRSQRIKRSVSESLPPFLAAGLKSYNLTLAFFSIVIGIVWGGVFPQTIKLTSPNRDRYVETAPPERLLNKELPDKISAVLNNPNFHWQHLGYNQQTNAFYPILAPDQQTSDEFKACQKTIATEMVLMLYARPDLLDQLMKQHLHFKLINAPNYPLKNANQRNINAAGHHCAMDSEMGLCIPEVKSGVDDPIDGYEVIRHEIGHWLDSINEEGMNTKLYDGLLPGWNTQEIDQFKALREKEKGQIQAGLSPLRAYALEDDNEFLSVLIEAYFEKGDFLSQSCPGLYRMMDEYFTHPKQSRIFAQTPSVFAKALSSALLLVGLPNGAYLLLRRKKSKLKNQEPAA